MLGFNLVPQVSVKNIQIIVSSESALLYHEDGRSLKLCIESVNDSRVVKGAFSLGYDRPQQNQAVIVRLIGAKSVTTLEWSS